MASSRWFDTVGDLTNQGNLTAYHETGSYAWPVLVMFGPSVNASSRRPSNGASEKANIPDSAAKLFCVRAKEATPGSTAPGSGGISGGNKAAGPSFITFIMSITVVLAGMLLF